jgi:uncharacterized protein YggE
MRTILLLAWLLLVPFTTWAAEAKPETPTLTVSGTGTLSLAPDTAFVTLGMETAGKALAETQQQNASAMQKVMERLLQSGIEKERIQTSSFTVTPQYRPQPSRRSSGEVVPPEPEIIGYTVSNMLTVEVWDLEKVGKVIDIALTAGANRFHGLHWALRDERQPRLRALKMAAAQAREKAQALGEALDVKLVRILTAHESGGQVISPRSFMAREMAMAGQASVPIASGELKVEASVTLIYEIK